MGIDAQTFSTVLPMGKLWRVKGEKALRLIRDQAEAWAVKNELGPFFDSTPPLGNSIHISILPIADSIEFTLSQIGVSAGFRSSNGGPGYHAAVIDLLDDLALTLKMSWNWRTSDGGCSDETGYALNRDFEQLQAQMGNFLRLLAQWVVRDGSNKGPLCLPYGLGFDSAGYSCPLGPKDGIWPQIVSEADPNELLLEAATFFPWWGRARNSQFWEAMILGSLWQNAVWRAPVSEREEMVIRAVEHAASRLGALPGQLGANISNALLEFRNSVAIDHSPSERGIGYRRRRVYHDIFQNWSIQLPGWLIESSPSEDNSVALFYCGDRSLRVTSFSFTGELGPSSQLPGHPSEWLAAIEGAHDQEVDGFLFRKSPPERDAEEGCYLRTALVAKLESSGRSFLFLTLAAEDLGQLDVFDEWLAGIGYREDATKTDSDKGQARLLH